MSTKTPLSTKIVLGLALGMVGFIGFFFTAALLNRLLTGPRSTPVQPAATFSPSPTHDRILSTIQAAPNSIDARWMDATTLYISVRDDGTVRDGLAGWACEVINEQDSVTRGYTVTIVDHEKAIDHNDWTKLGFQNCDRWFNR